MLEAYRRRSTDLVQRAHEGVREGSDPVRLRCVLLELVVDLVREHRRYGGGRLVGRLEPLHRLEGGVELGAHRDAFRAGVRVTLGIGVTLGGSCGLPLLPLALPVVPRSLGVREGLLLLVGHVGTYLVRDGCSARAREATRGERDHCPESLLASQLQRFPDPYPCAL